MSGFGDLLRNVASIGGLLSAQSQQKANAKLVKKKLKQQATPLEIPAAFQQLMQGLLGQADQLGGALKTQNATDAQASLAKALANLRQRGLASSNLNANLTAGNQQKLLQANNDVDQNVLAQKIGLQQGIGLQGLNTQATANNQLTGIQGSILGNLTPSMMQNPMMDLAKALIGAGGGAAGGAAAPVRLPPV